MDSEEIMFWVMSIGVPSFVLSSIVLYIKNRIQAKEEEREIHKIYLIAFIISMAIVVLFIARCAFLYIYPRLVIEEYEYSSSSEDVHKAVLQAMMDPDYWSGDYHCSKEPHECPWCKEEKSGDFYRITVEGTSHEWICEECYYGPYKELMEKVKEAMEGVCSFQPELKSCSVFL